MTTLLDGCRPAEILLVEDNESDALLTREAFKRARLLVSLHHVENGQECMAFLRKEGRFAGTPLPDLILLDLNMPFMDGREVLAALAADPYLATLPVAVLTATESEKDIVDGYALSACSHIVKPIDFAQLQRVVKAITASWFALVVRPPAPAPGA